MTDEETAQNGTASTEASHRRPAVLDIMVAIDPTAIRAAVAPSEDPDAPAHYEGDACYLFASTTHAVRGLASHEMEVSAARRSRFRCGSVALAGMTGQSVVIYDLRVRPWNEDATAEAAPLSVEAVEGQVELLLPDPHVPDETPEHSDASDGGEEASKDRVRPLHVVEEPVYYLQFDAPRHETLSLGIYFYITETDDETGQPSTVGYYEWDALLRLHRDDV